MAARARRREALRRQQQLKPDVGAIRAGKGKRMDVGPDRHRHGTVAIRDTCAVKMTSQSGEPGWRGGSSERADHLELSLPRVVAAGGLASPRTVQNYSNS